jgi:hypothetical protein
MNRRTVMAAVFAVVLAAPAGAQAANACRAHADHAKVIAESNTALVYAKGKRFHRYVRACLFSAPRKSYRLPGQDGGDTHKLYGFHLNGRYLGYAMIDQIEAAMAWSSTVYSVDLRKRHKLVESLAGDAAEADNTTSEVVALVVGARGAVAWINDNVNLDERLSVRAAAGNGTSVLDHGNDIRRRSLAITRDGRTVYWQRGTKTKAAALAASTLARR